MSILASTFFRKCDRFCWQFDKLSNYKPGKETKMRKKIISRDLWTLPIRSKLPLKWQFLTKIVGYFFSLNRLNNCFLCLHLHLLPLNECFPVLVCPPPYAFGNTTLYYCYIMPGV